MNATQPAPRSSSAAGSPRALVSISLALALLASACASPSPAAPPGSAAGEQVAEQPSDAEPLAVGTIEAAAVAAMFEPGLQRNLEGQHEQAAWGKLGDWEPVAPRYFRAELDSRLVLWGVVFHRMYGELSHEFVLEGSGRGSVGPAYSQRARWWSLLDLNKRATGWRVPGDELAPLRVTDIDGDGHMEIALKEHHHEATVVDKDLAIYLEVGAGLELVPVLALEHRSTYGWEAWERVVRLSPVPDRSPVVDVYGLGHEFEQLTHLGRARLERGGYLEPYVLVEAQAFREQDAAAVRSVLQELD